MVRSVRNDYICSIRNSNKELDVNKNTEANKLFNEFMFTTENGTLVISREDFNTIIKVMNRKCSEELRKAILNHDER